MVDQFNDNEEEKTEEDAQSQMENEQEASADAPIHTTGGSGETPAGDAAAQVQADSGYQSRMLLTIAVVAVILIALGVALWFYFGTGSAGSNSNALSGSGPVAIVNGEEVPRSDLEARMDQVASAVSAQQGQNGELSDEQRSQLQQRVASQLVQQELLAQYAEENGITVSSEDIDQRYEEIVNQLGGEDKLKERLSQQDMSVSEMRESLEQQLRRNKIIEERSTSSITVSDEEVRSRYEQLSGQAQSGQVPPFEQIKQQLRTQIEQQKRQQIIQSLIQELRQNGDVEVNV